MEPKLITKTEDGKEVKFYDEIWKPMSEYPGYWISNLGRYKLATSAYDDPNEQILPLTPSKGKWMIGYVKGYNEKGELIRYKRPIARMVAKYFIEIPEKYKNIPMEKLKVRNIDGDYTNNKVENLEWYSHAEMYSDEVKEKMSETMSKLSVSQFDRDGNWIANYESIHKAAEQVNGSRNTIWNVAAGNAVSAYGFYWEFFKPEYKQGYKLDTSNKAPIINRSTEYEFLTEEDIERLKTEEEIWKDIPGYEGYYQASNFGRIRTLQLNSTPLIMKASKIGGYYRLNLTIGKKNRSYMVHRLVAMTFIPIPQELLDQGYTIETLEVNHIDECKTNNKVENLEWCTREYNINYGTCQQRKAEAMGIKRTLFDLQGNVIKTFQSATELGKQFGLLPARINEAIHGKNIGALSNYIVRNWIPEYDTPEYNLFK